MNAPQWPSPYPPPGTAIAITTAYFPLSWVFAMVKPKAFVNGSEMAMPGWGRVVFPVWPGQYHVHVFTPYFIPNRVGPADYSVIVQPGQLVELEYKAPLWNFSRGSLGPPPQGYNGMGVMIASIAAAVLVVVLAMAVLVAAA